MESGSSTDVATFDARYAKLRQAIWITQEATHFFGTDIRGRQIADDLREFVLGKETEKNLRELRARAQAQQDASQTTAAQATLADADQYLLAEIDRVITIQAYWSASLWMANHRNMLRRLRGNDVAETGDEQSQEIVALESRLRTQLLSGQFRLVSEHTLPKLLLAYGNEKQRLLDVRTRLRPTPAAGFATTPRETACPPRAQRTSGRSTPIPQVDHMPEYSNSSKRMNEEGTVLVAVQIDAEGCVAKFGMVASSGWPALDDSALDWIESIAFLPAERDGKAVEFYATQPVIFRLESSEDHKLRIFDSSDKPND